MGAPPPSLQYATKRANMSPLHSTTAGTVMRTIQIYMSPFVEWTAHLFISLRGKTCQARSYWRSAIAAVSIYWMHGLKASKKNQGHICWSHGPILMLLLAFIHPSSKAFKVQTSVSDRQPQQYNFTTFNISNTKGAPTIHPKKKNTKGAPIHQKKNTKGAPA